MEVPEGVSLSGDQIYANLLQDTELVGAWLSFTVVKVMYRVCYQTV
ncbi:hypothetical protein I8752_08495 [Nostocaceae cyanobacterium CENA369]|uniref:Uncharacterized protein n=1 Tax=Dendronalium phyllosphericum CENA369 TaxID=1725256 RepID=A0A8J7LCP4_9NOST|nr:hypothetical protein [Dendronalium phyllosphericum]MBH8573052.1 hypothetical protein [Dendronalium phyllosphericum CENA369]